MATDERLSRIEQTLARIDERQTAHFAAQEERLERIEDIVVGEAGEPGLKGDVALLKSGAERARWLGRTMIGAWIATVSVGLWDILKR